MNLRRYNREVLNLLRSDYGVTDAAIEPGGSHSRCRFTYAGVERTLTLAGSPGHDFQSALNLKRQDVRRLLGEPIPRPTVPRRTLGEMTPSTADPPPLTEEDRSVTQPDDRPSDREHALTATCYNSPSDRSPRLCLTLPPELLSRFPDAIAVSRVGPITWQLRSDPSRRRPRLDADGKVRVCREKTTGGLPAFGPSPGTAVIVDDAVLVEVPVETRRPPGSAPRPIPPADEPARAGDGAVITAPSAGLALDEAYLREVLATIRRIEGETPYRLVKSKESGRWLFQAKVE